MNRFCLVAAALVSMIVLSCAPFLMGPHVTVLRDQTVQVDGVTRKYRLVIPDSLPTEGNVPLLFALHGAGGSGEGLARSTGLDHLAFANQFLVVYPEGRHSSWPPFIPPENPDYIEPDLRLFDVLCDELIGRYNIDKRRVYVTGMSQGAAFVNLLVAKRSDKIAAAAPHSGWLPNPLPDEGIAAVRECPMLLIAGTEDTQVPPEVVRKAAECFAKEGHPVELLLIHGLGHRWASEQNINATIWEFLSSHQLP